MIQLLRCSINKCCGRSVTRKVIKKRVIWFLVSIYFGHKRLLSKQGQYLFWWKSISAGFGNYCLYAPMRASALVYLSSLICGLMRCHIEFLIIWRREREVREKDSCFAKQPPLKLILGLWDNLYTTAHVVVVMKLTSIYYYVHKLRTLELLRQLKKSTYRTCYLLSCLIITWHCMRLSTRQYQCTYVSFYVRRQCHIFL